MADNIDNKEFDRIVRSVLENGTEEVPDHIWGAIESRLPSVADAGNGKTRKVIPVWVRVLSGVAAAIAVATFLTVSIVEISSPEQEKRILSDNIIIPPATETETGTAAIGNGYPESAGTALEIIENAGVAEEAVTSETKTKEIPVEKQEIKGMTVGEAEPTAAAEEKEMPVEKQETTAEPTSAAKVSEEIEDSFPDFPDEIQENRFRTSVTLSGNAISNTNSQLGNSRDAARPTFRPGAVDLKEDKVTESSESSYDIPISVGVGAKIEFTKRWSVGIGVNYSRLSRTFAGNYYRTDDAGVSSDTFFSSIDNTQDYIGIPVNVYFSVLRSKLIDFYAYAGGTAEKCISNRYIMTSENVTYRHREKIKGMQFSVNAGIGMEFIIANQFGIYLDPSIRYYFQDERQPNSIRTAQPLMFGVEMGLRIRL